MTAYTTPAGRALHDVVRDIAAAMPADWQTVETPHDHGARIVGPDGAYMHVRIGTYGAESGRLLFSAGTPDGADYSAGDWHGVDTHEMTAAADRDPAVIAREVTRKLIPGTLERHAVISGRITRRLARANGAESAARELATVFGTTAHESRGDWRADVTDAPGVYGGMSTSAYDNDGADIRVHVDVRGISLAHALELAQLIASWRVTS